MKTSLKTCAAALVVAAFLPVCSFAEGPATTPAAPAAGSAVVAPATPQTPAATKKKKSSKRKAVSHRKSGKGKMNKAETKTEIKK